MINKKISEQIKNHFLDLVRIPSPSGKEKRVGMYISKFLQESGWDIRIDDSGKLNHSNFGNLIASLKGKSKKKLLFVAHMDTVEKDGEAIIPEFKNGIFKSSGNTILGADNKASIAVLLTIARQLIKLKPEHDISLVFTTREETGIMGSRYLNINSIHPDYIFNIDGSSPVGTIDHRSMGQLTFEITIYGKAAHAALNPDKGINALVIGAQIITSQKMGLSKDGTTLNISVMKCESSTNIIPAKAYLKGEIRGFDEKVIDSKLKQMNKNIAKIVKTNKGSYKLKIVNNIPPFVGDKNNKLVNFLKSIIRKQDLTFKLQSASYTSDASYLSQYGIPTITICKGGKKPHASDESIAIDELEKLFLIIFTLISKI